VLASPVREGKEGMDFRTSFLPLLPIGDNPVPVCRGESETLFLLGDTTFTLATQDELTSWIFAEPSPTIISAAQVLKQESKTSVLMGDWELSSREEHPAAESGGSEHVDGGRIKDLEKTTHY
jgi:hypothetical protein